MQCNFSERNVERVLDPCPVIYIYLTPSRLSRNGSGLASSLAHPLLGAGVRIILRPTTHFRKAYRARVRTIPVGWG